MTAFIPIGATIRLHDGRIESLDRSEAEELYIASQATVAGKTLGSIGGRDEFERGRQVRIIRWLAEHEQPGRKRVLLIGDSIRMRQADTTGYGLHTYRCLLGDFNISHVSHNTGHTGLVLEYLDDWLGCHPDVVHFNAGLHDLSMRPNTDAPPPWHHTLDAYRRNLSEIVARLRAAGVPTIIWASSTPVHDDWHNGTARSGGDRNVIRYNADVVRYNAAAAEVMTEHGVEINDLYGPVMAEGLEKCLLADGVHLSGHGAALLGERVADAVLRHR